MTADKSLYMDRRSHTHQKGVHIFHAYRCFLMLKPKLHGKKRKYAVKSLQRFYLYSCSIQGQQTTKQTKKQI